MLLKLYLLKAGFPGQMGKSARGGPQRGRERLHQDPCPGFQEQDPSSFHLEGCAHSLQHHARDRPEGRAHRGTMAGPGFSGTQMPNRHPRTSLRWVGCSRPRISQLALTNSIL